MKKFYLIMLLIITYFFANAQVINKAKYFIDTDPGQGNAINIAIATSAETVNFTTLVSTTGLSQGFHNLSIRTRLSNGIWSMGENRIFYLSNFATAATNITAAEFFIDTDPGNGNGTTIAIGVAASPKSFIVAVPTTSLQNGFHNLIVRVKNQLGQWSIGENRFFYISSSTDVANIIAGEFFIDTDPGTGNGTEINGGSAGTTINFIANVPTTNLSNGFHNLCIRVKNAQGIWGHYENRVLYISNQALPAADITAMEFFIDTDPGAGLGTNLNVAPSGGIVTLVASIPTTGLTTGEHLLFLRAKSADGWGLSEKQPFAIGAAVTPAKPVIASIDSKTTPTVNTNQAIPIIKGTAEPATTIEIFSDTTTLGSVLKDTAGNWEFTAATNLPDGTSNITAIAKNEANLVSPASDVKILIVDTQAPVKPTIATINGTSTQNFNTANSKPVIVGNAEANSTVEIFNGTTSLGSVVTNAAGNYSFTPSFSLPNGDYAITTKSKDAVGNLSFASLVFNFKIDSALPIPPTIVSVDGKISQNFTTSNNKPTISGTAQELSSVELFNGTSSLGVVNATSTGNYALTIASALPDGSYVLTAKATKTNGNVRLQSKSFAFIIDTQAPKTPEIANVDGKTANPSNGNNNKPTIIGTAEAFNTITIYLDNKVFGTVVANKTGNWEFTPITNLPLGSNNFSASAKNAIGNHTTKSEVFIYNLVPISSKITANNILTPNGDGLNDYLTINNLQFYPKTLIKIFDRAGRIVYTANAYKNDWTGDANNIFLAEATYYYVVDLGPNFKPFKSFVTIIRNNK